MGTVTRYREAYTRYIGAGAVTMAGIITLIRTMPTIVRSLKESVSALGKGGGQAGTSRLERDIPISWVAIGSLGLALILAVLPILPGGFTGKLVMSALMLVFGFLFVTVSSRIVGLIGSSSNPISGMTIATLLGTALVFLSLGMNSDAYQPVALSVGAIVCIAAANAGATSQDLKTGFLVGATPIRQQIGLVIGVLVSTLVIGITLKLVHEAFVIGSDKCPAPQATLMATVIKGVMSQNLPWGYLLVGAGLSLMVYLAGVSPLAWAVGAYLPIGTTLPIFLGGALRWLADKLRGEKEESEISPGMLFATGLVAGGTLTGVASSVLKVIQTKGGESDLLTDTQGIGERFQEAIGLDGNLLALIPYVIMAVVLVRIGMKKMQMGSQG
jgi:putative OPT family oligopeptide transporter